MELLTRVTFPQEYRASALTARRALTQIWDSVDGSPEILRVARRLLNDLDIGTVAHDEEARVNPDYVRPQLRDYNRR